jgi:preprotein translocase subunit YajC
MMDPMMLIFIVLFLAMIFFLRIWPQRKRMREYQRLIEKLQKGDKVITIGGIYGEIDSIGEEDLIIRVEDGGRLKVLKNSIMSVQQSE